jgi:hypothetical protein
MTRGPDSAHPRVTVTDPRVTPAGSSQPPSELNCHRSVTFALRYNRLVFAAQPLLDRRQLARALKPGTTSSQENALRGLKRKGLLTEGLQVPQRRADGKVAGRASVYSSLNRDVLVLLRKGLMPDARALAKQAQRIEQLSTMKDLSAALAATHQAGGPNAAWEQVVRGHRAAMEKVVRQIERSRSRYVQQGKLGERYFGTIVALSKSVAELQTDDGQRMALPLKGLAARSLDTVGQPISFSVEDLGDGDSLLRIEPALVIGAPEDDADGLPPGVSLLDLSRIDLPGGATFEELLPEATIPVPITLS